MSQAPRELAATAAETTPERPWPVRVLTQKIVQYIAKMPWVWVEGQIVQLNQRGGTAYLTLRDTAADLSLPITTAARVLAAAEGVVSDGAHVVLHAKASFNAQRGSFALTADDIRPVGVGELLARIEHLKRVLAAEGLFDAARKVALPFLPQRVGLICGRNSKAEHDVVVNARERWPAVVFEIREVAVQGGAAVEQVSAAIAELDADPHVQVIIVTRGGGSVEDLLPFSNEALLRAAAACRTPLVSAIGHETDSPLLDLVADVRASTPTDAAELVVPDVGRELDAVRLARLRIRTALAARLESEGHRLDALVTRPAFADPGRVLDAQRAAVGADLARARTAFASRLDREGVAVAGLAAQVRALSPAATLARGYAVLRRTGDGAVVRSYRDAGPGTALEASLSDGTLTVTVAEARPRTGRRDEASMPVAGG